MRGFSAWVIVFICVVGPVVCKRNVKVLEGHHEDLVTDLPGQPHVDFNHFAGYVTVAEEMGKHCFIGSMKHKLNLITSLWYYGLTEMKRTGVRPFCIRMFEFVYTGNDGSYSDVFTQRKAIRNLIVEREDGLHSLDDDHIFAQVFGPDRPGRVRCRGHGVTPTSENDKSSRFGSLAAEEARRVIEIERKEAADAKNKELADYKKVVSDEMNKMKDDMVMIVQALRRLTNQNNGGSETH